MVLTQENGALLGTDDAESITLLQSQIDNSPVGVLMLGGDDTVQGSEDNEQINGNQGNDQLSGGSGSDTLLGGQNNDSLNGELGSD